VDAVTGRLYSVRHRTEYAYDDEVTASYGRAYLTPRDAPGQWTRHAHLEVTPEPDLVTESEDFFGNPTAYVEVHTPHRRLVVTATSEVAVDRPAPDLTAIDGWTWEAARDGVADWPQDASRAVDGVPGAAGAQVVDPVAARGFLLPSPQISFPTVVRAYVGEVFVAGRGVGTAVRELVTRIHADFAYRPGVTTITTPLEEVLELREGVCQDFAHLTVACLRSIGLPARYVSGYLETQPPPGKPRLQGADASHAWASVLLPELGWVDIDPTNDRVVDDDYVVTAYGRDYTDVPPLKGVIFTESAKSTLKVAVDVLRIDEDLDGRLRTPPLA
jgi:transglutaminase-like putative cysteine protease